MRRVLVCVCVLYGLLTFPGNAAAADDVVVYASDVSTMQGNWSRVSDATAAGGQKLSSSDNGGATIDAPIISGSNYFDVSVSANAQTPYHVWVRMRASGNSKWNDSAWLQFDDAVSASGGAMYRIGTIGGLLLNLEPCANCGTSGWGWVDGAYWLNQNSVVQFPSTGTHKIRVQIREDGVQIDQIVLSPARWLSAAPGQASNDTTIVAKVSSTPPPTGSSPYSGTAASIPGTVQAEDFDAGGEGVAYHDSTSGNNGGGYRSGNVDLEASSGGGYDVGWIAAGEWLQYSVNVTTAGTYVAAFRVASSGQGGTFHLEAQGASVSGAITIPDTGGWQSWQTVSRTVTLAAGQQKLRLVFDSASSSDVGNVDWMQFTQGSGAGQQTPYNGSPVAIPGTIQVEQFDNGGEGVAYHDDSQGNSGGSFRSTDVDIEPASGGGYDVGWTTGGEWLKYSVNVTAAGSYAAAFRVASPSGQGTFHLEANGANVSGTLAAPNTGGWQNWQTVTAVFNLQSGAQTLRLVIDSAGANFDSIQLAAAASTPPPSSTGSTIVVQPGQSLQAAVNAANPGDTIMLTPGATYSNVILPVKSGSSYITIRSAAADTALPGPGTRILPQDAGNLPKIQGGAAGAPAIATALGAHHWRLQFLELTSTWEDGDILTLGDGSGAQDRLSSVAHDLIVDRVYIHGVSGREQKRGIALNSASTTIMNSYISNIRETNTDTQAIAGWNGPGPFTIRNNYLEAAGENILFGGGDPSISNLIPSDIVLQGNTVTKQLAWRSQGYTVKNLIELKNARRVTIDGNVIEYSWESGQFGHAIVLTPRNQDGTAPWSTVQQIQITNNVIRHVASVLNVLGTDNDAPSGNLQDVTFRNNLVLDMSKANWGGAAQLLLTSGGANITVDHNTVFSDGSSIVYADGPQVTGFVFTNNIVPDNVWAIMGSGSSAGNGTLAAYFPGAVVQRDVFISGQSSAYPTQNYFPSSIGQVGFVDLSGNFRLTSGSPYRTSATDGSAIGADITAINNAAGTSY